MGMYHHNYHQNLLYWLWYYIKSDNNWYEVIWYVHKKKSHIYPSTYDLLMQMILPEHVLVHIWDDNDELILLLYVSPLYATYSV